MPFLSLVHLRELRCEQCGAIVAQAGARSFITDQAGDPLYFATDDPPAEMVVHVHAQTDTQPS